MSDLATEIELEKKPKVKIIRKGGLFGKLVSLLLGIVIGFIGCFGAIAAVVYYAFGVMKIKEAESLLNNLGVDFTYTDFVGEQFGDKTAIDLVMQTADTLEKVASGDASLNSLNEISPFVSFFFRGTEENDYQDGLIFQLQNLGLNVEADKIMQLALYNPNSETNFNPELYVTDYLLDAVYNMPIGDVMLAMNMHIDPIFELIFYGEEGVDFTYVDGKRTPIEGGTPFLTIEGLFYSNEDALSNRIFNMPLDTILKPNGNKVMEMLVYGKPSRYTILDGNVTMNQVVYTLQNGAFFDDESHEVAPATSEENGVYTLTLGNTTQYVKQDESTGNYLVYQDEQCTRPLLYKKTSLNTLNENPDGIFNAMELGALLELNKDSNKILLSLAYGKKDVDYTIDENGNILCDSPRTLNDLLTDSNSLINNMLLCDLLSIDSSSNKVLIALAYGQKGVDYTIDENGNILCDSPRTLEDLMNDSDNMLNAMYLYDLLGIDSSSDEILISLAYGQKDVDYTIDKNGNILCENPRTLGDLMNDSEGILNETMDATALDSVLSADYDDAVTMYLLYGIEGKHYKIVDGEVVMLQKLIALVTNQDGDTVIYNEYGDTLLEDAEYVYLNQPIYKQGDLLYPIEITANKVNTKDGEATLYRVYNQDGKPVLFEKTTLGKLKKDETLISHLTDRLTLKQVMGEDALIDTPMESLGDCLISEAPHKIKELQLKEILGEDEIADSKILKNLGDETLDTLPDAVDNLTFSDIFDEEEVQGNNVLTYLYNAKDPETEKLYPLTDLTKAIDAMTVSDVFSAEEIESNNILRSLATDSNGDPVLIKDMSDRLDELTVQDVFGEEMYKKNANGEYVDKEGNVLPDQNDSTKYVVANPIIHSLRDSKITELGSTINDLTVGDIFGEEIYVKNTETGEYETELVDVKDENGNPIFDENGNPVKEEVYLIDPTANHVLASLHDTKISQLSTAMGEITVGDMFAHEIYKHQTLTDADGNPIEDAYHFATDADGHRIVDPDANPILVHLKDTPVNKMNEEVETLTVGEVFEDEIYETDEDGNYKYDENGERIVKGSWYYLLKDSRAEINGQPNPQHQEVHDDYKLTSEMGIMMSNMTANIKTASLKELDEMGIIDLNNHKSKLLSEGDEGKINWMHNPITNENRIDQSKYNGKTHYYQLTIEELFDYVADLLDVAS